jgi:O-antigen ligase
MFAQRPILGWGLGTFETIYPQFRSFYTNLLVDKAHNDYLQLVAETGLVGFAIMIWFLVSTFRRAVPKIRNWPSDVNGAVALAAVIGIAGILVHSLVDFNLEIPANALLFYVLCAVAAIEPRFRNSRRDRKNKDKDRILTNPDQMFV